jgi:hypothetical protein
VSAIVQMTHDGEPVTCEVVTLGAFLEIPKEFLEDAAHHAVDQLRRYAKQWQREGWQFLNDPEIHTDDDFLRNVTKFVLSVQAWRRPGMWTAVDTQVLADTGAVWP